MAPPIAQLALRALLSWYLPLAILSMIVFQLVRVEPLPAGEDGSVAERDLIARDIRTKEPDFRRKALKKFPGDTWSQGDDFSRRERDFVRSSAGAHQMRVGAVLDAIDRDVRALPSPERGAVPPCMPRIFYE